MASPRRACPASPSRLPARRSQLDLELALPRHPIAGLVVVLGLWAAALVLINPAGNFPLMDDWTYAVGVQSLVTDGALRFSPYMEATGIVLAAAGIGCAWTIAREVGATSGAAAFAAAVFAFNPIASPLRDGSGSSSRSAPRSPARPWPSGVPAI